MKLSLYLCLALSRTNDSRVIDRAIEYAKRAPNSVIKTALLFAPCELRTLPDSSIAAVRSMRTRDLY